MTELLVKWFIRDKENINDAKVRQSYGRLSGLVGICCNVLLFALKLFAGLATGAVSIMADAFNNLSDAASSVVTLIGFYMAGKPADLDHPYGHGRIEYLSGLFIAAAILMTGVELMKSSVEKILHPEAPDFSVISIIILIVSILLKMWMARFNLKLHFHLCRTHWRFYCHVYRKKSGRLDWRACCPVCMFCRIQRGEGYDSAPAWAGAGPGACEANQREGASGRKNSRRP